MKRALALALLAGAAAAAPVTKKFARPVPTATAMPARGGWRTAHWGMSVDQVLAALPGEAVRVMVVERADPSIQVEVPKVTVLGIDSRASFFFGDKGLWKVRLSADVREKSDAVRGKPSMGDFESWSAELTKKYGPPATEKRTPWKTNTLSNLMMTSETATTQWVVEETAIELVYLFSHWQYLDNSKPETHTRLLAISYSDRAAASSNL